MSGELAGHTDTCNGLSEGRLRLFFSFLQVTCKLDSLKYHGCSEIIANESSQ